MADSSPYTKSPPPFSQQMNLPTQPKSVANNNKKGKSYSSFLFKSLFFLLFLLVFPLFPSQAPDFLNQTILTKLWELLHLLFVGIAVAYGLFSRRNIDSDLETHPTIDNTPSYVSKVLPGSSIFGDECENPYGSDEKRMMMHCWNFPQYYDNNAGMVEQYKPQLQIPEGSFSDVRYDGTNVVQAWNSEYYQSEPVVVMAQPYYTIGECDEIVGYKPLGLPVRSLRSTVRDSDTPNSTNESDSSSRRMEWEENHKMFSDDAGSAPSIPWQERSRRMEIEEDHGGFDDDVMGFASPVLWQTRSRRMENEENDEMFGGDAESGSSVPWLESSRRMEIEEDHGEFNDAAGSASPIRWQTRSRRMESEENYEKFNDVAGSAYSVPWLESSRRMGIAEDHGEFNDVAGSASSVPWLESSRRMGIAEDHGEFNNGAGSASPILRQTRSRRMESEEDCEKFNEVAGSASSIPWQESCGRMEIEENHDDDAGSSSPIPWQTMMESEENHGTFNDAAGSSSPIPWSSRSRRTEIEETKFESLSSRAFQSSTSLSSRASSYSSSGSLSPDNVNLEVEEMGQKKHSYGSSSENMNFQEEDTGGNKTSHRSPTRYRKIATREKYAAASRPSHFRPMSVDETQFESLNSRSFQSTGSFSSRTSLFSSFDSVSSENMKLPKEDLGEKKSKSSHDSSSPTSLSPPARRRNGEASLKALHSRGYSVGSLLRDDMKSSMKDDSTGSDGKGSEAPSCNDESGLHFLKSDSEKTANSTKAPSKGKSVRTRRSGGTTSETKRTRDLCIKPTDEKVEKVSRQPDSIESIMRREKLIKVGADNLLKGIDKQNMDPPSPKPEVTFSGYCKPDEKAPSKSASKEDSSIELENLQESSVEDKVSEYVNDSGLDSEVDKKASEFIARFKAQIRLQKEASMDRSRGLKTMKKIIGET